MPEPRAAGVDDVEAIAIRVAERVITEVTAALNAKFDHALAEIRAEHGDHDERLGDLAATVRVAAATVTKMVADLASAPPTPPAPGAPLPRPAALDAACAAAADKDGPQSVRVEVYGRVVRQYVAPRTDPAQVWTDLCATIRDVSGAVAWHN
ncbi:hypothetical protein ACIBI3_02140 [Actinomadura luteofluorescens]|uniref:hypothetical protein n=1 Tax=Actinomadura luteofluorescens TaxID=46163 RepID=UPI0034758472